MLEHAEQSVENYDGYWMANYNPGQPTAITFYGSTDSALP